MTASLRWMGYVGPLKAPSISERTEWPTEPAMCTAMLVGLPFPHVSSVQTYLNDVFLFHPGWKGEALAEYLKEH